MVYVALTLTVKMRMKSPHSRLAFDPATKKAQSFFTSHLSTTDDLIRLILFL